MLKYIFAAIIVFLLFIVNVMKNKMSRDYLFILKTVFIVLLLEVTVFNINSYRTDFGSLKYEYFYEDTIHENTNITTDNTQYVFLKDINTRVKSVYVELSGLDENQVVDYDIFYSDSSTSNRFLASKNYCQDVDKTKYSTISLSRRL